MEIREVERIFIDSCDGKNYQVKPSDEANNRRLDISNFADRTIVKIYRTGTIQIQGKQNPLKAEMEALKAQIETNLHSFLEGETLESKPCATKYDIMLPDIRITIKETLHTLDSSVELIENPNSNIEYRSKIIRNSSSLTLTQFNNGTLLLQGKTDKLFHDYCDLIEKIANPSDKEIIARFVSSDEETLDRFVATCTPQLINLAEKNVKAKLGNVYDYLGQHDQKLFTASECLCLAGIPLPEYSALVMPASKAFEGFAKKILADIGLVEADHFKKKNANFSALSNPTDQKRKTICDKERHADTMLKQIELTLKKSRHFMMHSDESRITKVGSQETAEDKVNNIFKNTKEIFEYFNEVYSLR